MTRLQFAICNKDKDWFICQSYLSGPYMYRVGRATMINLYLFDTVDQAKEFIQKLKKSENRAFHEMDHIVEVHTRVVIGLEVDQ